MKKFKLKIFSLIACVCMLACTLTGCALTVQDKAKALSQDSIKIGNTVLTKQEVSNLWYSFYTENASYFYYYSEDQILDIFYKNVISRYAILEETRTLIKDQTLCYTLGDEAKVWLQVLDYISGQLDTREKALTLQSGVEQKDLPERLKSDEDKTESEVKSYLFTDYQFKGLEDYKCKYTPSENKGNKLPSNYKVGKDVASEQINQLTSLLEKYVYKYKEEVEEEDEVDYTSIDQLKDTLNNNKYFGSITGAQANLRSRAFDMYVGNLMLTAKANGKNSNRNVVLKEEIKRLYINYYENYLYSMYTNYVNSLLGKTEQNYPLSDRAVVARYLQLLGRDIQNYSVEENYIAVVEAESKNALLLYYYEGEYYYFTVQHLLVSFDDQVKEDLSEIPGSNGSASVDQYNIYKTIRDNFYTNLKDDSGADLASWGDYKNVTYRDKDGYDVYINEANQKVYFDKEYKPNNDKDVKDEDKITSYYRYDIDDTTKIYLKQSEFEACKKDTITVSQMESLFNNTYDVITKYIKANSNDAKTSIKEYLDSQVENGVIEYSLSVDLIEAYTNAIKSADTKKIQEVEYKLYTNLFMQHAFRFSADSASLGNELSNRVGMIIGNNKDNNTVGGGTYVSEFTNGARELLKEFNAGNVSSSTIGEANYVISDYGIHLIVINDVYKGNKPVTGETITYDQIFGDLSDEEIDVKVAEAKRVLDSTFVCKTSSQTLWQYVYDIMVNELVGSNGVLFTQERNKLYNEYMSNGKAKYVAKMSYKQLMDAIN